MSALCPLCRTGSPLFLRTRDLNRGLSPETFEYFRCGTCGLIFLDPIPADLGRFYAAAYYAIPASPDRLALAARGERYKIEIVRRFAREGRLLEIGAASGTFAYLAKEAGFHVDAVEMDPVCCRFMSDVLGIRAIQSADIPQALAALEPYDVIALWHVIEHLPDPWNVLATLAKKLRPGGVVVMATPNPAAWQFRVQGRFWPHVDAPRHLSLIPVPLLAARMEFLGLKTVLATTRDKGSLGWNNFGWRQFLSNMSSNRYMKAGLRISGGVLAGLLSPMELREGLGSAYTAVFRKEGAR